MIPVDHGRKVEVKSGSPTGNIVYCESIKREFKRILINDGNERTSLFFFVS